MTLPYAHLRHALVGVSLGFILSNVGFTQWSQVHAMFTLQSPHLPLVFASALALTWAGYRARGARWSGLRLPRGLVVGSLVFGLGWALTGACPSVALIQLGEGQLTAVVTLAGIALGVALHAFVQARYLRFDRDSCDR